ncbi:nicotinate-nicotinamide nucleotide adenylyltransferase [Haliea atlantica]
MSAAATQAPVAMFGGTFNPIHHGHLRSAVELVEGLALERLHLVPCATPPHRESPGCPATARADMVELAVRGESRLSCDRRELQRDGPSWTVDSLAELRREYGEQRPLCLVVGCDAVLGLPRWHRWQELLGLAHVVVLARPGWELPRRGKVADWLGHHRLPDAAALGRRPAGGVLLQELRPLPISSTEIRHLCATGHSPRFLLPDAVLEYIVDNALYREAVAD